MKIIEAYILIGKATFLQVIFAWNWFALIFFQIYFETQTLCFYDY